MKKIVLLAAAAAFLFVGCAGSASSGKKVLCGSSIILSMVKDCGGDIGALTLVPADVCPGNFDLKPEDAEKVISASVFLIQPFQLPLAEKALKINPKIEVEIIKAVDLTTPENYFRGLQETALALGKYFPGESGRFFSGINSKINEIRGAVIADTDFIQSIRKRNITVLSSLFQAATARYMGLDVVDTFGGPESLKPRDISRLISAAKAKGVSIIISNLTGTHDAAADILNKNLKIKKVVFIVFPAETEKRSMFLNLWDYNISQLKSVLGE